MFDSREKLAIFIDGANLFASLRALDFDIDYRKLLVAFQKRGYLLRAYYYTVLFDDHDQSPLRPLIDWLDYNGYKVVSKQVREFVDPMGHRKIRGNMDMELAIDALEQADKVDHFVLFSGNGDFVPLVETLQRKGRKITVISTTSTIADELRRQSDSFVDLVSLKDEIARDPSK